MRALRIYGGPGARRWIATEGLQPEHVRTIPAAAGGPKGLILGPLDRFLFTEWLSASRHTIDLVGASIGAWRMATACLDRPGEAFERLERDYIRQDYEVPAGQKRPSAEQISAQFAANLQDFFGQRIEEVLGHGRFRLHVLVSRGRHLLGREQRLRTPLGYLGAFMTNSLSRRAMGAWIERVVFSTPQASLPFRTGDYRTRALPLTVQNFQAVIQASCAIPFVLRSVHEIPGAPAGAYWDGGITDYHLHLDYRAGPDTGGGIVLYPHFQRAVIPGWLDKGLRWRHRASRHLDNTLVLAPDPQWVSSLPNGKLPDRTDFARYGRDLAGRVRAWTSAVSASRQLADEWAQWLHAPDPRQIEDL